MSSEISEVVAGQVNERFLEVPTNSTYFADLATLNAAQSGAQNPFDAVVREVVDLRAAAGNMSAFDSRYAPIATIGRVAGRYYRPAVGANSALAFALANGTEFAVPFFVSADDTFDRIAINVTVAGAAGSVIRLGIKKESGGAPGDLVLDAGTVDSTGTGAKTITISQSLTAGWYWLVAVGQGSPATNPEVTNCIAPSNQIIGHPTESTSFSTTFAALSQTGITGALANGGTFSGIQERAPLVMVRAS